MNTEQLITSVSDKIRRLANADESAIIRAEQVYLKKNSQLRQEIADLKEKLVSCELVAGYTQFFLPPLPKQVAETSKPDVQPESPPPLPTKELETSAPSVSKPVVAAKTAKKTGGDLPIDVSRLDLRVGKIVEVERHPDADSLYVEKVDLGEGHLRTVISGLVQHVPIEKMHNIVGIFMCNLKPVKMRGIESQGMLMCATDANQNVEPLVIESSGEPNLGDRVFVEAYPGEPDEQLNPKKKVWEQVKPDMRVDSSHLATYKGTPWKLKGDPSAVIKAPTLVDAQIS